ncbi:hypothetical protein BBJ28_00000632 [Nothophytophthora sp. Chile5]|nr:hypothetical protein BBJ28_00000632 [Nothophytophthora sp. Chile5]
MPQDPTDVNASSGCNAADLTGHSHVNSAVRIRKRSKSLVNSGAASNPWMALATRRPRSPGDDTSVLQCIHQYWEQLSANERQQILFMDEPELVKQLYKLNLSLLCVGLMQRHLKAPARAVAPVSTKQTRAVVTPTVKPLPTTATPEMQEQTASPATTSLATDTAAEKTYELLEAMEFMDIGTGILTVKTELIEDTERLLSLVGDVLAGFLTSVHVLTEKNFYQLFVTESETINTWANYQRLIAMLLTSVLVFQLILKSYVGHLEKEAALQMERLLLEVSLEDGATEQKSSSTSHSKKKNKKKKRKATAPTNSTADQTNTPVLHNKDEERTAAHDSQSIGNSLAIHPPNEDSMLEPMPEPTPEPTPRLDHNYQQNDLDVSEEPVVEPMVDIDDANLPAMEPLSKRPSGLNPNAIVFQPQEARAADMDARNGSAGKRKLDEYIISIPWQDVEIDEDQAFECNSRDGDSSEGEEEFVQNDRDRNHRRWRKQRRYEEDAKLEWQLQEVYASTASLFGWDFSRQCELTAPGGDLPWSESTLWRTAPKEVVRYFSPVGGDSYSAFQGSHFLPNASGLPVPPPSPYYFNPGPPMPFAHALVPPPGLDDRPKAQAEGLIEMALLLRRVTFVAASASRAGACAAADAFASASGARGFATKKKEQKKKGKKGSADADFELMLRSIKGRYPDAYEWTDEEQARHQEIGRRFNAMSSIEHNHFMRDLQTKIDLKWEAINALPTELQAEAMQEDDEPIPEGRGMATWTPPIPGFRRFTDEGAEAHD